jgi:hypothetical protein
VDYYDTDLSWKLAKYLLPAAVEVPDAPGKVRLEFHPVNFLPAEAEITLRWQIDSESGWRIEPAERTLRLDGGHSGRWSFTATVDPARAYPAPRAEITLGTDEGETRGSVALPVGRRTIRAFRAAERPELDGSLDDPAWQQAKTYRGFIGANGTARPGPDTRVRVLWDEEKLYFAFECLEPTPSALKRNERGRDGMVYADDAVEVFIEPDDGSGRYGQFIVNSLGTIFDGSNLADASMSNWNAARWKTWNADWSAAASLGEDRWVCEMAVPLSSLTDRPPQPGDRWGFNAARDRYGDLPRPQYSSFTAMPVFFHLPKHFGELIFVGASD